AEEAALAALLPEGVQIVSALPLFCPATGRCETTAAGEALYSDAAHVSPAGARRYAPALAAVLRGD
ncbi:MAG: SGNH hydrolase domain-containing protein, partial [Pseudomonadota bacterium]